MKPYRTSRVQGAEKESQQLTELPTSGEGKQAHGGGKCHPLLHLTTHTYFLVFLFLLENCSTCQMP